MAFWKIRKCFKNPLYVCTSSDIGDHIRKRRKQLGLHQKGVAELIGVSTDTINFWENGRFRPMISHYPAIISFLRYNPFLVVPETLGDRINSFRKLLGFSVKRFGQLIGVDGSTVSSWEAGQNVPRKSTLRKLNKILGRG